MIIRTHIDISNLKKSFESAMMTAVEKKEEKIIVNNEISSKKKKKKTAPTSMIAEEPVIEVAEEKTEDEDLSKWLEEHTED